MDKPGLMRRQQALPRLPQHVANLGPRPLLRGEPIPQRGPLDALHRDEHPLLVQPNVVHRDHIRVRDPSERLRLPQQPRFPALFPEQQLDRHRPIKLLIDGREHDPHPPAPKLPLNPIPPNPRRHVARPQDRRFYPATRRAQGREASSSSFAHV